MMMVSTGACVGDSHGGGKSEREGSDALVKSGGEPALEGKDDGGRGSSRADPDADNVRRALAERVNRTFDAAASANHLVRPSHRIGQLSMDVHAIDGVFEMPRENHSHIKRCRSSRACPRRASRGFTLIETALATVIVGVGVLAMVAAQQGFHRQNGWSTHASIATRLGNEIREMTLNLPRNDPVTGAAAWGAETNETWVGAFDDLDDFDGDGDGLIFSAELGNGPLNARREVIPDMAGWAQEIYVRNVDPFDIHSIEPDNSTSTLMVEVVVTYQAPGEATPREMTRVSWITPN